jgi:hypothetical protein
MNRSRKLRLITESAELLSKRASAEIDLILRQFDCDTEEYWPAEEKTYCLKMVQTAAENDLEELHGFLTGGGEDDRSIAQPWAEGKLRLFFSHLVAEKKLVGEVKGLLQRYGIDAFVAHDSIEPTEEWVSVIDSALSSCDAGVAFLHPKFSESKWCDQEIGYMLSKRVPVLPLMFGASPYGFLGKYQGFQCIRRGEPLDAQAIGVAILDWLKNNSATQSIFTEALVGALETSRSWDTTRAIWPQLSARSGFSPSQLRRLEAAAERNIDVADAFIGSSKAPELIKQLVARNSKSS